MQSAVATRYAKALFDVASTQAEKVLDETQSLQQFFATQPEVGGALTNPALPAAQRSALVEGLLKAIPVSVATQNLLRLLSERNRFDAFGDIVSEFRSLVDTQANRIRGTVTSAAPLSGAALTAISDALSKATKQAVVLESKVDPKLLGGVVAKVENLTFDGSVRNHLNEIERALLQPIRPS